MLLLHFFFVMVVCVETYMAMLHNASHRSLCKASFKAFKVVIYYGLCMIFGQTWNTYFLHYVKHHHVEDNGPEGLVQHVKVLARQRATFALLL
jgi:hypothetical protein